MSFFVGQFIPTRRTPGVSTSELLTRIVAGYRKRDFDGKLEKIGRGELMAEGSDYDDNGSTGGEEEVSNGGVGGNGGKFGARNSGK